MSEIKEFIRFYTQYLLSKEVGLDTEFEVTALQIMFKAVDKYEQEIVAKKDVG